MRNKALVVGSIVYDEIFTIHGNIKDEIPLEDGSIKAINLMFTARNRTRYFGGTAGNIAYGLGQTGETPLLFSCVGSDFEPYYIDHLRNNGIEPRVFNAGREHFTATFYGISDEAGQQIGIFQPNAYGHYVNKIPLAETLSDKDFDNVKVAIFSPGTGTSTLRHVREVKKKTKGRAITILDPGQELSVSFGKGILEEAMALVDMVIVNEVEMAQLNNLFGLTPEKIHHIGPKTIIETKGDQGAVIMVGDKSIQVQAYKAPSVMEATGAGDAFRAGLIKGLLNDWDIQRAARLAARLGALSVAYRGGQGYALDDAPDS